MSDFGPQAFDAALGGSGVAPEHRRLDVTVRSIQERYGELTWTGIILTCEDLVGATLPEALIESLDSLADLYGFLEVRAHQNATAVATGSGGPTGTA